MAQTQAQNLPKPNEQLKALLQETTQNIKTGQATQRLEQANQMAQQTIAITQNLLKDLQDCATSVQESFKKNTSSQNDLQTTLDQQKSHLTEQMRNHQQVIQAIQTNLTQLMSQTYNQMESHTTEYNLFMANQQVALQSTLSEATEKMEATLSESMDKMEAKLQGVENLLPQEAQQALEQSIQAMIQPIVQKEMSKLTQANEQSIYEMKSFCETKISNITTKEQADISIWTIILLGGLTLIYLTLYTIHQVLMGFAIYKSALIWGQGILLGLVWIGLTAVAVHIAFHLTCKIWGKCQVWIESYENN